MLLTDVWLGTRKKYTAAAMMASAPVKMAISSAMAPNFSRFFMLTSSLTHGCLPILASLAARNKHFEKNTQTFSQKGSSLPKEVQIKVEKYGFYFKF